MVQIQPQQIQQPQYSEKISQQTVSYPTEYGMDGMPLPLNQNPMQGAVFANKDDTFLKWLFSFTSESLEPLRNNWLGNVLDENGSWVKPIGDDKEYRIMNNRGVSWGISLLRSYFNPVFFVTSMNYHNYNFRMREASRFILFNLFERHIEFELKTSDIPRVAEEIESKIAAILSGALQDGYRVFLSTQNQNIENRTIMSSQPQSSPGIFSKMSNSLFKKEGQGGQSW